MNSKLKLSKEVKTFASINKWLLLFFLLFTFVNLKAQRVQLQMQIGINASEARIQNSDVGYISRETATYFDTLPMQLGLGAKVKVFRNFYVRLDGNYKAYRTFFSVEESTGGVSKFVSGNLFNEKYSYSLMPEYQYTFLRGQRVELPVYGFAGPVFSFEKEKNYSDNYLFSGGSTSFPNAVKPDAQLGWSLGLGCNPKWKRIGIMLEGRLLRIGFEQEGILPGKIAYQHFTLMTGITYDLF